MDILYSRALAHFVAAYDCRNLRSAAEVVHVTQPAISKSIGKLEGHIGMPLFERTPTGVLPTEFAHMLRRHAQNIMNEARFVATEIAALTDGSGGLVRIGVGPAWSLSVMPRLLSRFQSRFPNIDLEVATGVTDHLLPILTKGDIDVWMGSLHDVEETDVVSVSPVGWSDMTVFVCKTHPLAGKRNVGAEALSRYSWVCFVNDTRGLERLDQYFRQRDLPAPRYALRLSSLVTMFATVAGSELMIYVADTLRPEAEARGLVALRLAEPIWGFDTGMAYRRSAADLASVKFLKATLPEVL